MTELVKGFREGTHRLVSPEATYERIRPHLAQAGVTRSARVTWLDRIGIPVHCALRPAGRIVQVANGKGCSDAEARVSALMEAIESFHIEQPLLPKTHAAAAELPNAVAPETLWGFLPDVVVRRFDWIEATQLGADRPVMIPASAVWADEPGLFTTTTNGLASGNHLVEATLHALYELVERHAITTLSRGGSLRFNEETCRIIETSSVRSPRLGGLLDRVRRADARVVLLTIPAVPPLVTCMAILLDPSPFSQASHVNIGSGTHLDAEVAATRAVTEAAQSRLTFIHGAREDLTAQAWRSSHDRVYRFFDALRATSAWEEQSVASGDLGRDLEIVLDALARDGKRAVYRVDLTRPDMRIPVARLFVPGLEYRPHLF